MKKRLLMLASISIISIYTACTNPANSQDRTNIQINNDEEKYIKVADDFYEKTSADFEKTLDNFSIHYGLLSTAVSSEKIIAFESEVCKLYDETLCKVLFTNYNSNNTYTPGNLLKIVETNLRHYYRKLSVSEKATLGKYLDKHKPISLTDLFTSIVQATLDETKTSFNYNNWGAEKGKLYSTSISANTISTEKAMLNMYVDYTKGKLPELKGLSFVAIKSNNCYHRCEFSISLKDEKTIDKMKIYKFFIKKSFYNFEEKEGYNGFNIELRFMENNGQYNILLKSDIVEHQLSIDNNNIPL